MCQITVDLQRRAEHPSLVPLLGFVITNILFYFGGWILGISDISGVVAAIQSIFFGLIL
jgi:hypothetical protein